MTIGLSRRTLLGANVVPGTFGVLWGSMRLGTGLNTGPTHIVTLQKRSWQNLKGYYHDRVFKCERV